MPVAPAVLGVGLVGEAQAEDAIPAVGKPEPRGPVPKAAAMPRPPSKSGTPCQPMTMMDWNAAAKQPINGSAMPPMTVRRMGMLRTRHATVHSVSPLIELDLDAAVLAAAFLGAAGVDRPELAEAGGGEAVGGNAAGGEVFHHGDRARSRQLPVGGELR